MVGDARHPRATRDFLDEGRFFFARDFKYSSKPLAPDGL